MPRLEWGQHAFTHETNERAVDSDKDIPPALNNQADTRKMKHQLSIFTQAQSDEDMKVASDDSTNTPAVSRHNVPVSVFFTKGASCYWFWPLNHCLWPLSAPTWDSISLLGLQTGINLTYNILSKKTACICGQQTERKHTVIAYSVVNIRQTHHKTVH